jgi:hypothetical protein
MRYNQVVSLESIVDGQIQNYVIHYKHLNTIHPIKIIIVIPKMIHVNLHSPF